MAKRPSDTNQLAKTIIDIATSESDGEIAGDKPAKNPAAVELGRRGGQKGGPARARKLSPKRLKEIAKKAAAARWKDKKS